MVARPERRGAPERNFEMVKISVNSTVGSYDSQTTQDNADILFCGIRKGVREIEKISPCRLAVVVATITHSAQIEIKLIIHESVFGTVNNTPEVKEYEFSFCEAFPYDEKTPLVSDAVKSKVVGMMKTAIEWRVRSLTAKKDAWNEFLDKLNLLR